MSGHAGESAQPCGCPPAKCLNLAGPGCYFGEALRWNDGDECPNYHGPDGVIACWSPGGPCPEGRTVCECCGPCNHCRPGEHPYSPGAST